MLLTVASSWQQPFVQRKKNHAGAVGAHVGPGGDGGEGGGCLIRLLSLLRVLSIQGPPSQLPVRAEAGALGGAQRLCPLRTVQVPAQQASARPEQTAAAYCAAGVGSEMAVRLWNEGCDRGLSWLKRV